VPCSLCSPKATTRTRRFTATRPSSDHKRLSGDVSNLDPTIQLLFKAKNPRPEGIADFNAIVDALPDADPKWPASALTATHPDHPWVARLRDGLPRQWLSYYDDQACRLIG
jgi:hypothetical protein